MESYIAGGVESVLLDELQFKPSPGASYILNKSQVRFFFPAEAQYIALQAVKGSVNQHHWPIKSMAEPAVITSSL